MGVAEHFTNSAVEWAPDAGLAGDPPLEIRMNPFLDRTSDVYLTDPSAYLHQQASSIGRSELFTLEALGLIIEQSRDLPRRLRSIAQLAFFAAASERACQIQSRHVTNALASLIPYYDDIKNIAAMHGRPDGTSEAKREVTLEALPAIENQNAGGAVATTGVRQEIIQVPSLQVTDDLDLSALPASEGGRNALEVYWSERSETPHQPSGDSAVMIAVSSAEKDRVNQRRWLSRSVGISSALVGLFLVAGAISSNWMSSSPKNASHELKIPAADRSVGLSAAVVQEPAPANAAINLSTPNQSAPQEETPTQQAGSQPAVPEEISPSVPKSTATANRTSRKQRAAIQRPPRSLAEDEGRTAREAPDQVRADDSAVEMPRQFIPLADETVQQPTSSKEAEERTLAQGAARRDAEDKAAAKRAVAEMLAADQLRAREESVREARLAADKAQAEKDAADQAKAEEVEQAEKNKGGLRFGRKGLRLF